ncbi:MAG: hypothetical protein AABY22_05355, partial [Nanoarchaeota archaeon]
PASNLGDGPYYFEFDKRNGDLVDLQGPGVDSADGSALLAMSHDAQAWAAEGRRHRRKRGGI